MLDSSRNKITHIRAFGCRAVLAVVLVQAIVLEPAVSAQSETQDRPGASRPTTPRSVTQQLLAEPPAPGNLKPRADQRPSTAGGLGLVAVQMDSIEQRLRRGQVGQQTHELQLRVLRQLDDLIQRSAPGQRTASSGAAPSTESRGSGEANAQRPGDGGNGRGNPAGEVFERRQLNAIWLRLPAMLQQRILSPLHEDFLPSYRQEIVDYYQRLSEGRSSDR